MPKDNLIVPVDSLESGLNALSIGAKTEPVEAPAATPQSGGGDYDTSTIARPSSVSTIFFRGEIWSKNLLSSLY